MSEPGARPGGLTALAIFNFLFAAMQLISGAGAILAPMVMPMAVQDAERRAAAAETRSVEAGAADTREAAATREKKAIEEMREANRVIQENRTLMFASGGVAGIIGLLLIVSGIGYLKLRRFLGRNLGTIYALIEIAWGVAAGLYVNQALDQEFSLWSIIGFIYPLVTLFMLHVTFKHDFVNP